MATRFIGRILGLDGPQTILFRVVALVLSIVIPLVCLFLWVAVRYAGAKTEFIELQRFETSTTISRTVEREMAGTIGLLNGVAASEHILTGAFGDFAQQVRSLVNSHSVAGVWLVRADGTPITASIVPEGAAVALDRGFVARAFSGRAAISSVLGMGAEEATALVAVPVRDGAGVGYGLVARVKLRDLSRTFAEVGVPASWVSAVVDAEGRFVARSLDAEHWLGDFARPELIAAAKSKEPDGIFGNVTHEGVAMQNSYNRSALTGWTTVVAVPATELRAPLRRAILLVLLGGATILIATLVAASWFATKISEPVRRLSQFAHALGSGATVPPAPREIIELEEVREALEHAVAGTSRLSAIVASSGDAIISVDLDGTISTWNKGAEDLFGYTAEEIIGCPKTVIIPDESIPEFEQQTARLLAGENFRSESKRKKRDGTVFPVSIDAAPVRRPDGTIVALSSILHDITSAKFAEEHKQFLMRELAHRSKNQLAIIQSIANQTSRRATDLPSFLANFRQRLQGLSASHDLLMSQGWQTVELSELIARQLGVFADLESANVTASGPPVRISAVYAEAIGLALHELATNSTKYGALSVPTGKVDITWTLTPPPQGAGPAMTFELTWSECGGPPVVPPSNLGFGSQVIETMVARSVGGEAAIEYRTSGIFWRLSCELK